jgi:hypothetical protein
LKTGPVKVVLARGNGTTLAAPYESVGRLRKKRIIFGGKSNSSGNGGWCPKSIDFGWDTELATGVFIKSIENLREINRKWN